MFNVIVKTVPWVEGHETFPLSRIMEYTDAGLMARFNPQGALDLAALTQLPTIFMEETSGAGDQVAHVGTILGARVQGRQVVLEIVYDRGVPPISNRDLEAI